jgi:hypothetical protein
VTDIPAHELPLMAPHAIAGARVLEFGDKRNPSGVYRTWYEARGCEYVCVDINGRHGAHPIDVRKAFSLGQFDLVTNWGFSEHVSVQRPFWDNAHHHIRPGGHLVGTTPKPHEWLNHGWSYWHPMREFFEAWAEANRMQIVSLEECGPPHRGLASMWGFVLRRTTDAGHVWRPEFDGLFWRNTAWEIPVNGTVHCA